MAEDEVLIKLRTEGDTRPLRASTADLNQYGATASKAAEATRKLNQSFEQSTDVKKLGDALGLTANQAAAAAKRIQELNATGASSAQKFRELNTSLGVTREQFDGLDDAIAQYEKSLARSEVYLVDLADAQTQFAGAIGKSYGEAEQFADSLGLTARQAADASARIQSLNSVNASVEDKFLVLNRTLGVTRDQFDQLDDVIAQVNRQSAGLSNFGQGFAQGLGQGAFDAVSDVLTQIPGQVLDVNVQFEKYQTVLTNALQSTEAANEQFGVLQDFAADTPYQLDELVGSFIKLQQRGLTPTVEELEKAGDIAASQGKSFDMFAEAILDATGNEYERLKEFGIRASKSGDQVTFSFRGVNQTVAATPEAIKAAILSFGELEGVQGSMAALSQTLGGQLSNLADTGDKAAVAFGQELLPVLTELVQGFNEAGPGIENFASSLGSGAADVATLLAAAIKLAADNGQILSVILQTLLLRMAAIRAIALFNTFVAAAAGITAAQAASLSLSTQLVVLRGAMVSSAASAGALVASLAPLLVVAGAIAGIQFAKFANDLANANTAISGATAGVEANTSGALAAANRTKAALDELNKTRQAGQQQTQQEIEDNKRLAQANDFRLQQLQKDLELAEQMPGADEAQRQAKQNLIQATQTSIDALQGQNDALKQAIGLGGQAAQSTQNQTEALKEQADALKEQREQGFDQREQQREDTLLQEERAAEDENRRIEAEFQRQQEEAQASFDQARQVEQANFEQQQKNAEAEFNASERAKDDAFQQAKQQREKVFNDAQRAAEDAFQKDLEARQRTAQDQFQSQQQAVDRQVQLATATGSERRDLQKQFTEQDREAQIRDRFERQAFGGLNAEEKQRQIEEQFQKESEEFAARQQAEREVFEEQQRQIDTAYQQQKEQAQAVFEENQRLRQASFEEAQQLKQAAFEEEGRLKQATFEDEQRARDRAAQDAARAADRAFEEEKRAYEQETARLVKQILESTNIPSPTPTPIAGRRMGGPVGAGTPYWVGEAGRELIVPAQSGYVLNARQAREIALATMRSPSLSVAAPAPVAMPSTNDRALLKEVVALRQQLAQMPRGELRQVNHFAAAPVEDTQFWERQYRVARTQRRGY